MPNGVDKNLDRLRIVCAAFYERFGIWPTSVRLDPLIVVNLVEFLTVDEFQRLSRKLSLTTDERATLEADGPAGTVSYEEALGRTDFRTVREAQRWLSLPVHHHWGEADVIRSGELADAGVVAGVAAALREWSRTTGKKLTQKPLREAVWFYWERPRLPAPKVKGKYPEHYPWSAAARAAYHADPAGAKLEIEHTIPMTLLTNKLVDHAAPSNVQETAQMLKDDLYGVVITPEESKQLDNAGVGNKMPPGWSPGDEMLARYSYAGLDVTNFAPLGSPETGVESLVLHERSKGAGGQRFGVMASGQ